MPEAVFCIYCGTPVAEHVPLKPGKGYGIRSLFWATVGWLALFLFHILDVFSTLSPDSLWSEIFFCLILSSPFCIVAGFVYGILGRNTEGRRYAHTGIVLSALYIILPVVLFILLIIAYTMLAEYW